MRFAVSSKSLLQNIWYRHRVFERPSGNFYGDGSLFQRSVIFSSGKHSDVTLKLPFLNRFIHATGAYQSSDRDYYDILGISSDASLDEIKKAFHALAKKHHPDASKNNPSSKIRFQEIRDAYESRKSSERPNHAEYCNSDEGRSEYEHNTHFSDSFHKIFSEIFENENENSTADIQVELELTFSEAAKGCTKNLSFDADVPCDFCYGQGYAKDAKLVSCPTCQGSGNVKIPPFATTCGACKGFGQITKEYCLACKGSGIFEGVKDVRVKIPAGVDSGDTIRVPNAGNSNRWGRPPSTLFIKLKVAEDSIFSREGADIYVDNHISFTQAILGGNIEVPTLSGKVQLQIPKGVQPGHLVLLRGKGLPKSGFLINRGDQYVRFRIRFPSTVNERQRSILEEFEEQMVDWNYTSAGNSWWQHWLNFEISPKLVLEFSTFVLILLFLGKVLN